jgi:hypothetical protein
VTPISVNRTVGLEFDTATVEAIVESGLVEP